MHVYLINYMAIREGGDRQEITYGNSIERLVQPLTREDVERFEFNVARNLSTTLGKVTITNIYKFEG